MRASTSRSCRNPESPRRPARLFELPGEEGHRQICGTLVNPLPIDAGSILAELWLRLPAHRSAGCEEGVVSGAGKQDEAAPGNVSREIPGVGGYRRDRVGRA